MAETLLEMTKDLVLAQIATQHVTAENLADVLQSTHETLRQLHRTESVDAEPSGLGPSAVPAKAVNWKASITKHAVTCLECGATFRQLSRRHLQQHDLDPRSYRHKYGMPLSQALSAREVTARRKALANDIRPWEQAAAKRAATSAPAKAAPAASRKRAKA